MVLRPRLKIPDSPSRARSPQTPSENIANHQATIANNPIKIPVKLYTILIQAPKNRDTKIRLFAFEGVVGEAY